MDALLEILAALTVWRLLLSIGVSALLAVLFCQVFPAFTVGYGFALVLLGTGFGFVWHVRANAGVGLLAPVPPTPVSKPVAFLGLLLIGFFWGGLISGFFSSQIMGAIALVGSVGVVGAWYRFVLHRPASLGYLAFAGAALLSGFALLLVLKSLDT